MVAPHKSKCFPPFFLSFFVCLRSYDFNISEIHTGERDFLTRATSLVVLSYVHRAKAKAALEKKEEEAEQMQTDEKK